MYYTLSQAATATGKSKSVISKSLKNGDISYIEKTDKGYKIDPSELFRVFPKNEKELKENGKIERKRTSKNTGKNTLNAEKENSLKLELLTTERNFYKEQLEKAEKEKDDWKKQAQTLLLQYAPIQKQTIEEPPRKGFWGWLVG